MATTNIEGKDLEYDTTMCSTSIGFFSTTEKYSRELKVKAELDRLAKLVVTTDTSNKDNEDNYTNICCKE